MEKAAARDVDRDGRYGIPYVYILIISLYCFCSIADYGHLTSYTSDILAFPIVLAIAYSFRFRINKQLCAYVIFYVLYIVTSIININDYRYLFTTCILGMFIRFSFLWIDTYVEKKNKKSNTQLCNILIIIWLLIAVVSSITYYNSENGGRDFTLIHSGSLLGGGYYAAYASTLIAIVLMAILLSGSLIDKKKKIFVVISLIILVTHVFLTQSTITIVALIAGIFAVLVTRKKRSTFQTVVLFFLIIVLSVFAIVQSNNIGYGVYKLGESLHNIVFSRRLKEVGVLLQYRTQTRHLGLRAATISIPWKTFLSNPLFGIGWKYGNMYSLLSVNGLGTHSDLLDAMAQFGLVGCIPYFAIYYYQFKKLKQYANYNITSPLFITFIILFSFNPFLSNQTIFALFLLIPLLIRISSSYFKGGNYD